MLRPQTWYLALAAVCAALTAIFGGGTTPMLVVLVLGAVGAVGAIPLYKNRKLQASVVLLVMALLVAWYVLLAVLNRNIGGTYQFHWTDVMPAVAIVLSFLARKGILHDEKVMKGYDRIR